MRRGGRREEKTAEKERPDLEPLVEKWADIFNEAEKWRVSGMYVQPAEFDDEATTGDVLRHRANKWAVVRILDPHLDRQPLEKRFGYDVEEDVIHEHCHLLLNDLETLIDEAKENLPDGLAKNWAKRVDNQVEAVIGGLVRILKGVV